MVWSLERRTRELRTITVMARHRLGSLLNTGCIALFDCFRCRWTEARDGDFGGLEEWGEDWMSRLIGVFWTLEERAAVSVLVKERSDSRSRQTHHSDSPITYIRLIYDYHTRDPTIPVTHQKCASVRPLPSIVRFFAQRAIHNVDGAFHLNHR